MAERARPRPAWSWKGWLVLFFASGLLVAGGNYAEWLQTRSSGRGGWVPVVMLGQWGCLSVGTLLAWWWVRAGSPRSGLGAAAASVLSVVVTGFSGLVFLLHFALTTPHFGKTVTEGVVHLRPVRDLGFDAIQLTAGRSDGMWEIGYNLEIDARLIQRGQESSTGESGGGASLDFPLYRDSDRLRTWFAEHGYAAAAEQFESEAVDLRWVLADSRYYGLRTADLQAFDVHWVDRHTFFWAPTDGPQWIWPFLGLAGFGAVLTVGIARGMRPVERPLAPGVEA